MKISVKYVIIISRRTYKLMNNQFSALSTIHRAILWILLIESSDRCLNKPVLVLFGSKDYSLKFKEAAVEKNNPLDPILEINQTQKKIYVQGILESN